MVWEVEGSSPTLPTNTQGLRITEKCAAFAKTSANS